MYRASSPRAAPELIVHAGDEEHGAYDTYAVSDELCVPMLAAYEGHEDRAVHPSTSSGLAVQPLLDRITSLAGEKRGTYERFGRSGRTDCRTLGAIAVSEGAR